MKSAREEGAGLGQITRAFNPDGSIRFDALADMRAKHSSLREWSWSNVYDRPDLQIRAVVLMMRDNFNLFEKYSANTLEALAFADAAYNGGAVGVNKERRACKISTTCDPSKWFGHTENFCMKSKVPLYGNRSACDINRHHVKDVLLIRSFKYMPFFQ